MAAAAPERLLDVDAGFGGASMEEVPDKAGWLWKHSIGKSVFGRKNWKCRYFLSNIEGVTYYGKDSLEDPRGSISWDAVTHVYPVVNSAIDPDADDPESFYFGIRFLLNDSDEKLLLMRCDNPAERRAWVDHFGTMRTESVRLMGLVDDDDDENERKVPTGRAARRALPQRGVFLEKVTRKLRQMVSLKKQRFQQDGMDLDLAYITPTVIAMGYPSEGREAMYRNPYTEVIQFFEKRHGSDYRVFNLCSERWYPPSRFSGRFERWPFDDHNPPPLALIAPCCAAMHKFLTAKEGNAVAVHCKAGKGRTGLIISAYLLYAKYAGSAAEALTIFAKQRTKDGKGVQIPSQKRYMSYFEQVMKNGGALPPDRPVRITKIVFSSTPRFDPDGGCDPYVIVKQRKRDHRHMFLGQTEGSVKSPLVDVYDSRRHSPPAHVRNETNLAVPIPRFPQLRGEFQIHVYDEDALSKDDIMMSFWLHSGLMPDSGVLVLGKPELDDAVKDKHDELMEKAFTVTLYFDFPKKDAEFDL